MTGKALGTMPAEWEPHASTWVSWPHNPDTWPGAFEKVEPAYREMVAALAASEPIDINVLGADHETHVRRILEGVTGDIRYHHIPTNDAWCRDHGATFLRSDSGRVALDFDYNAWGGKYPPFDLDAQVARRMADITGARHERAGLFLEGGAIEVNGEGVLLTTESCVLNPNRNPGLGRQEAEERLKHLLGVEQVIWVDGEIEGDDTDGHIDNLARFVGPRDIVMSVAGSAADRPHRDLEVAMGDLAKKVEPLGIRVHPLPLPDPIYFEEHRLPASYANFYIGNRGVVVPTYGCSGDRRALAILAGHFPGRTVIGVDCRDIVWGLGAVHCLTQQVPA